MKDERRTVFQTCKVEPPGETNDVVKRFIDPNVSKAARIAHVDFRHDDLLGICAAQPAHRQSISPTDRLARSACRSRHEFGTPAGDALDIGLDEDPTLSPYPGCRLRFWHGVANADRA